MDTARTLHPDIVIEGRAGPDDGPHRIFHPFVVAGHALAIEHFNPLGPALAPDHPAHSFGRGRDQHFADRSMGQLFVADQIAFGQNGSFSVGRSKLFFAEIRLVEIRVAEIRVVEVRAAEIRVVEVRVDEIRAAEIRLAEIRVAESRAAEIRLAEIRVAESRAAEIRLAEIRAAEVRVAEIRVAEIRVAESRAAEIRVVEIRVAEIRVAEIRVAEVGAAEVRVDEVGAGLYGCLEAAGEGRKIALKKRVVGARLDSDVHCLYFLGVGGHHSGGR